MCIRDSYLLLGYRRVTCKYGTKDGTAMAGADYEEQSGELVFEQGVTKRQIQVEITDDGTYEKEEQVESSAHYVPLTAYHSLSTTYHSLLTTHC